MTTLRRAQRASSQLASPHKPCPSLVPLDPPLQLLHTLCQGHGSRNERQNILPHGDSQHHAHPPQLGVSSLPSPCKKWWVLQELHPARAGTDTHRQVLSHALGRESQPRAPPALPAPEAKRSFAGGWFGLPLHALLRTGFAKKSHPCPKRAG